MHTHTLQPGLGHLFRRVLDSLLGVEKVWVRDASDILVNLLWVGGGGGGGGKGGGSVEMVGRGGMWGEATCGVVATCGVAMCGKVWRRSC